MDKYSLGSSNLATVRQRILDASLTSTSARLLHLRKVFGTALHHAQRNIKSIERIQGSTQRILNVETRTKEQSLSRIITSTTPKKNRDVEEVGLYSSFTAGMECSNDLIRGANPKTTQEEVVGKCMIVATGSFDGKVTLWDVASDGFKVCTTTEVGCRVSSLVTMGGLIFVASRRREILGFRTTSSIHTIQLEPALSLHQHQASVNRLAISATSKLLASTSDDMTIALWDLEHQVELLYLQDGHDLERGKSVWGVDFHRDGSLLATTDFGGVSLLWDLRSGKCLRPLPTRHLSRCTAVRFSPNGIHVATGGDDGLIHTHDLRMVYKGSSGSLYTSVGHSDTVTSLSFSSEDDEYNPMWIASSSLDGSLRLWDTRTGAMQHVVVSQSEEPLRFAFFLPSQFNTTSTSSSSSSGGDINYKIHSRNRIVFGGKSHWLKVWSFDKGEDDISVQQLEPVVVKMSKEERTGTVVEVLLPSSSEEDEISVLRKKSRRKV